jgi:hypothetical protein
MGLADHNWGSFVALIGPTHHVSEDFTLTIIESNHAITSDNIRLEGNAVQVKVPTDGSYPHYTYDFAVIATGQ